MSEDKLYPVSEDLASGAWADRASYESLYAASVNDPDSFWRDQAQRLDWLEPFTQVKDVSFNEDDLHIRWFADGKLNVSANCLDRHLAERADQTAIIWESDDGTTDLHISYRDLHERVCRMANALKALGANKGDRITI